MASFFKVLRPFITILVSRLFVALSAALISFGYAEDAAVSFSEAATAVVLFLLSYLAEQF